MKWRMHLTKLILALFQIITIYEVQTCISIAISVSIWVKLEGKHSTRGVINKSIPSNSKRFGTPERRFQQSIYKKEEIS